MKRDDEQAFVEFVDGASPRLLRTAWLICGDPVEAEELVQAAMERLYRAWPRVRPGTAVAFTRKVILNLHIDTRRWRSREWLAEAPPETGQADHSGSSDDTQLLLWALSQLSGRNVRSWSFVTTPIFRRQRWPSCWA